MPAPRPPRALWAPRDPAESTTWGADCLPVSLLETEVQRAQRGPRCVLTARVSPAGRGGPRSRTPVGGRHRPSQARSLRPGLPERDWALRAKPGERFFGDHSVRPGGGRRGPSAWRWAPRTPPPGAGTWDLGLSPVHPPSPVRSVLCPPLGPPCPTLAARQLCQLYQLCQGDRGFQERAGPSRPPAHSTYQRGSASPRLEHPCVMFCRLNGRPAVPSGLP